MHVTFRQLQIFLSLAEHRSVTAAARACHITQPTASMQLKELSDAVGLPLYEQVGKTLYLTSAGEQLAETARSMSDDWARFEQSIEAMKGHTKGRLRVAVASTAKYFIPRILGSFCAQYPEIDISLQVLNRDGVVARLRQNMDDLNILSMPPEDLELERYAFLSNPLVLIVPADYAFKRKKRLALQELAEQSFILRESGSGTRLACDAFFRENGFKPKVRLELGSNEAVKQAVASGLGIGIISVHALGMHFEAESLAILPVKGMPIHSNWWVLYPKGKRLSPIASVFLKHLQETAADIEAAFQSIAA
ncbi:LysR family transcriptional regulator [Noviherbaspirillum denitrificans]|uniref:LysR family transcriptional regulator n=1 Tax=Noviherbaspirillum denitrificans TaxID=1968433 RepID=A0A254T6E2_9BURK|nr:LysR family transcriptional regulator [Noviherbaspirillum denitrificans]OWW18231.1 LysR family transcriptional regulator [Noviherbaspirillum denitrificans]